MVRELLSIMPAGAIQCSVGVAACGAVGGAALWLGGARFSRSVVTLAAVAIGTLVGIHLPRWMGWRIDGIGLAFAGALVLGLSGYLLHRTWIGIWLGTILAVWAVLAVLLACPASAPWVWPQDTSGGIPSVLARLWQGLPPELTHLLPIAGASGFTGGILAAVFWPKISRVLTHSLIGITLLVGMGASALHSAQPQWLLMAPSQTAVQVALVLALATAGAAVQWKLLPAKPAAAAAPPRKRLEAAT